MSLLDGTGFGVFWNEGGTYVFYAELPGPGNRRRWLLTPIAERQEDAERAPTRCDPREHPLEPASGRLQTPRFRATS
jgi:hypothetical protein